MNQFQTINKNTALYLAKRARDIYGTFLLNLFLSNKTPNANEQLFNFLRNEYPNRDMIKMMMLNNILLSTECNEMDKIPYHTRANISLSLVSTSSDVKKQMDALLNENKEFKEIVVGDIRNALFHGKFNIGYSPDLKENVLVLRPNTSKINSKGYKKAKDGINTSRFFDNDGSIDTYSILIKESDLFEYVSNIVDCSMLKKGKESSPLDVFAFTSLCLYLAHEGVDFELSRKDKQTINMFTSFSGVMSVLMPLCMYCQDDLDKLRKECKNNGQKEPEDLTKLFAVRDMIAHRKVFQTYENGDFQIRLMDQYKDENIDIILDRKWAVDEIPSKFLQMFEKNKEK